MISEQRDPAFWTGVAGHPEVGPRVLFGASLPSLAHLIELPSVLPLASKNGGFLFFRLDGIGRVWELHTMYRPEGWGREVAAASKAAFDRLFSGGASVVCTYEVQDAWRSRPPLSHGWKAAGPFSHAPELAASVRTWVLTREAYLASPARRRSCPSPSH